MSKEMREALIQMQDQSTHTGYVAYTIYFIATWLAKWGEFDSDSVDVEYERVWKLACEFLDGYDNPNRPFADCVNEFMNKKEGE